MRIPTLLQGQPLRLALLLLLCFAAFSLFYLSSGIRPTTVADVFSALSGGGTPDALVIETIRVPRLFAAILAGMSFAVAGTLMQGVTNNPLASPSILGINAGASFGLALAMVFFEEGSLLLTMAASFLGAAIATGIVLILVALRGGKVTPVYIALAGTAVSAVFLAITEVVVVIFDVAQDLSYWTAGGLGGIGMGEVISAFPWIVLGLLIAVSISRSVTLLAFGDELATGLGGRIVRIRLLAGLSVLLLAGSAVSVAGPVGFIGLVVPHIVRQLVGIDYRRIIPFSALLGALLTAVADLFARTVAAPFEAPLGAVTALVGVPFFLYLANRKEAAH